MDTLHSSCAQMCRVYKNSCLNVEHESESSISTSDVGFKHGRIDVDVEVDGVLEDRRHSLELCTVSQNLQREHIEPLSCHGTGVQHLLISVG